jgi:hypothetical protein
MRITWMRLVAAIILTTVLFISRPAAAQGFDGGGAFGFDPEIGIVNSGAVLDAQVVVSHDRRYVTINMFNATQSRLLDLAVFPAVGFSFGGSGGGGGAMGFVGGAGFIDEEGQTAVDAVGSTKALLRGAMPASPVKTSPAEILKVDPTAAHSVLRRQGMMRLERRA